MFDVTEEPVGDRLGKVPEPDIPEGWVVRETFDSEEERIDNAVPKSVVPFLVNQKVLPASRGDKIRLDNELRPGKLYYTCNANRKKQRSR